MLRLIVGIAAVLILTFSQRLIYNEKVLAEKSNTAATLKHNNDIVGDLKDNIRVLNTNETLAKLRVPADKDSVQVVFDALPASANSAALGSALQSPELLGKSGIKLESLNIKPVAGVEDSSDGVVSETGSSANAITFEFSVSTSVNNISALKDTVKRLERSIRAFNIQQLRVETQGGSIVMKASGEGYYEPARVVQLTEKEV